MPTITIDGRVCQFEQGKLILQVALDNGLEIPHYCYHPGLSIVASCRICLVEVWAPNPRADNRLEPIPKLLPACQTQAGDGQVVHSDSPKAIANQRAVMEYLLINHPSSPRRIWDPTCCCTWTAASCVRGACGSAGRSPGPPRS
jgi:NADH-quinone oxidoreductase subunit G